MAEETAEVAVIEIVDSGEGIDEEELSRVFNPFYTTKPEGKGTGLGLSVSYGIVQRHGGSITLDNISSGGARVLISLPLEARQPTVSQANSSDINSEQKLAG